MDLTFTSPYAFMGAYLLADYDVLVRAVLTRRHIACSTATRPSARCARQPDRAPGFNAAQGYKVPRRLP